MQMLVNAIIGEFRNWKYLGNCSCSECGIKLTRSRAKISLFCNPCFDTKMGHLYEGKKVLIEQQLQETMAIKEKYNAT